MLCAVPVCVICHLLYSLPCMHLCTNVRVLCTFISLVFDVLKANKLDTVAAHGTQKK